MMAGERETAVPTPDPLPLPRRLLVIMLADAGDLLLATPALRALRHTYPNAHIALLTKPSVAHVLHDQGMLDETIIFDKHLFDQPRALLRPTALLAAARFLVRLRGERFDTALLLHHLSLTFGALKYAGVLLTTGAAVRVGLDNGRGWFLTHRAPDHGFGPRHQADYWLDVAAAAGGRLAPADDRLPRYHPTATANAELDWVLRERGVAADQPLLVLHPGSGGYSTARRWSPRRFAAVATALGQEAGLRAVVVGGPVERALAQEVAAQAPDGTLYLAGETDWPVLAALLARARLVVANDGGVAHLAGAVGAPVVTVFGPTNDAAYRPLGPRTRVVRAYLPCVPCLYRGHRLGNRNGCPPRTCLGLVTEQAVLAACRELLALATHQG